MINAGVILEWGLELWKNKLEESGNGWPGSHFKERYKVVD